MKRTQGPDEKEKYYKNASDGAFWMSFNDFLTEFEKLDICLLPDERFFLFFPFNYAEGRVLTLF